jgi:dTDP-4-dehydrorhamnose 3,5-epimerase
MHLPVRATPLELDGLVLLSPVVHEDARGSFVECFRRDRWAAAGVASDFVQDNHSRSIQGTLRGMHFQPGQAKLVRVGQGRIFDVAVDIRPASSTFGRWQGVELDDRAHQQLVVPDGFAHGFCELSEEADVIYKVSAYYDPATEAGFRWDDPEVGIDWPVDAPVVSERDRRAPSFAEVRERLSGARR